MNEMTLKDFIKNKDISLGLKLSVIVYLILIIPFFFLLHIINTN